jgi:NAD(P)-dependent dehydrogenase (short-subunit alcohol dehydrogenase family)
MPAQRSNGRRNRYFERRRRLLGPRALDLGDDAPRLRWTGLCRVSSFQEEACAQSLTRRAHHQERGDRARVYASSKWAINCFVQTVRRQVFKHGIRVGSISPGPVISALLADWPPEKLKEAKESGSLLEASEVAAVVMFMLTRPRGMTIRDVVMLPTNFDL